jgi:hypothetical protein
VGPTELLPAMNTGLLSRWHKAIEEDGDYVEKYL